MNLRGVETVVRDRLGLDPASLGPAAFPLAVEGRMRARGCESPDAYAALAAEPGELAALAAELVVPETWFFRGGRALFERLAAFVATRAAENPGRPVRILSVPCSTGEEPYSLALALYERLVPPDRFTLDAVDLSPAHLDRAIAGSFTAFSFREAGTDIRPAYFRPDGERWVILPHVRDVVRFHRGNVTDPAFLVGKSPYDLIMCRNLFIYLTPEGRGRAAAVFDRLLAPDGWLCLTPGEADRLNPAAFRPEGPVEFGVYRRAGVGTKPPAVPRPKPVAVAPLAARTVPPVVERVPTPAEPAPPAAFTLGAARNLADAGRLADARVECERLVAAGSASAGVYSLLGVIAQAEGRDDAAGEAFRRALYLDPHHPEALEHMIGVCERRGDVAQAAALRRRLARLTEGGAT